MTNPTDKAHRESVLERNEMKRQGAEGDRPRLEEKLLREAAERVRPNISGDYFDKIIWRIGLVYSGAFWRMIKFPDGAWRHICGPIYWRVK